MVKDGWPVIAEDFKQWVVEDNFCDGMPAWDKVRYTVAQSVTPTLPLLSILFIVVVGFSTGSLNAFDGLKTERSQLVFLESLCAAERSEYYYVCLLLGDCLLVTVRYRFAYIGYEARLHQVSCSHGNIDVARSCNTAVCMHC